MEVKEGDIAKGVAMLGAMFFFLAVGLCSMDDGPAPPPAAEAQCSGGEEPLRDTDSELRPCRLWCTQTAERQGHDQAGSSGRWMHPVSRGSLLGETVRGG